MDVSEPKPPASSPHSQRRDVYQPLQYVYQMQASDSEATLFDVSVGTHSTDVSSVRTLFTRVSYVYTLSE